MTEQEKVIERLAKIKRHAESAKAIGSDAEAETFAAALQKMLLDNKLSMTDLEFAQFEKEQPVGFHFIDYAQYPDVTKRKKRTEWIELLANVIADAHFCRICVHPNSSRITLVGREEDCKVAEYLIMTLTAAAERLSVKAYGDYTIECVNECARCGMPRRDHFGVHAQHKLGTCRGTGREFIPNWAKARGFKGSYLRAFIARLFQRFDAERKAREAQSTALVRINTSKAAVNAFFEDEVKKKAGALSGNVRFNREGVKRGSAAAEDINLRANAMEAGQKRKAIR